MIIFHQFFLPDLYYYPTSPNLTKSHAHIISQRSSPPLPSQGRARRWSEKEKKRRREKEGKRREASPSEQQGRASRRAAALMVMAGPF